MMDLSERIERQARSRALTTYLRTKLKPGESVPQAFKRLYPGRTMADVAADFVAFVDDDDRRAALEFMSGELLRRHVRNGEDETKAEARLEKDTGPFGEMYRALRERIAPLGDQRSA